MAEKKAKYQITGEIGRGGMGVVYKGVQLSLNRPVAIKTLPAEFAQDYQYVERVKKEAVVLSKLQHPNIVYIYDIEKQNNNVYMIMEYITGKPLSDLFSEKPDGRFTPKEALKIIRDVASALKHAHKHGIVHRDIKPANIMITEDGMVKVTDFGIARMASGLDKTKTGLIQGTPYYMSPEQIECDKNLDGRSDIYSLGIVFYQLLTGQPPFSGASQFAIFNQHLHDFPESLANFITHRRPSVYENIIWKCIAKKREDRFQTAEELIHALDQLSTEKDDGFSWSENDAVDKSETFESMGPRTKSETRVYWLVAALLLLIAGGVLSYFLFLTPRPNEKKTQPPQTTHQIPSPPEKPSPLSEKPLKAPLPDQPDEPKTTSPDHKASDRLAKARVSEKPFPLPLKNDTPASRQASSKPKAIPPVDTGLTLKTGIISTGNVEQETISDLRRLLASGGIIISDAAEDCDLLFAVERDQDKIKLVLESKWLKKSSDGVRKEAFLLADKARLMEIITPLAKREYCFKALKQISMLHKGSEDYGINLSISGGQNYNFKRGDKLNICLHPNKLSHCMLLGVDFYGIYLIHPLQDINEAFLMANKSTCIKDIEVAEATGSEMVFALGTTDETLLTDIDALDKDHLSLDLAYIGEGDQNAVNYCRTLFHRLAEIPPQKWTATSQFIYSHK